MSLSNFEKAVIAVAIVVVIAGITGIIKGFQKAASRPDRVEVAACMMTCPFPDEYQALSESQRAELRACLLDCREYGLGERP